MCLVSSIILWIERVFDMLTLLKENSNLTLTENDALTLRSTMSDCVDLFATIGALRSASDAEVEKRFMRAYAEDPDAAMRILFFARDVRGGLGERKVFRTIIRWLAFNHRASVIKNLDMIVKMGRWDDLTVLLFTPCHQEVLEEIRTQLEKDKEALSQGKTVSLLAKWLPSVNTSNKATVRTGKLLVSELGMSEKEYRKTLSALRLRIGIIENNLREKDYSFDYECQPSKAMLKYRMAFCRNDEERYRDYLKRVERGEAVMHTSTLTPCDVIAPIVCKCGKRIPISEEERRAIDVIWRAQENFAGGENALVVVDGSGSMYDSNTMPSAAVAQSLAIYFAERNKGEFANHFITFSETPRLIEIKGEDIVDKVKCCMSYNEVANTDIQKVFQLILYTAVEQNVPQDEMPGKLFIISDMEFDRCADNAEVTNFEYAKQLFEEHGYRLPEVVFWNVRSRNEQQPVKMNDQGVVLVSGRSPRVFAMLEAGTFSPYEFMMETISQERYSSIVA